MISLLQTDIARLGISGGRTVMDQITESLLSEFASEYDLTELSESKKFEHFAAHLVLGREQSESFDTHDFIVGDGNNTSSGGDTGIDAIAVIVNGALVTDIDELEEQAESAGFLDVVFVFIQAETSSGFDGAKILTFGQGVTDFFRDQPLLSRSDKVKEAALIRKAVYSKGPKFKKGNPVCKMSYVTTGRVLHDAVLDARVSIVKDDLDKTDLFRSVEFERVGKDELQRMYQRTKNSVTATFEFTKKVTVLSGIAGVSQAFSGYLPWTQFRKLIESESGKLQKSLFFDNVRDWQGNNDVNNEIRETLWSARLDLYQ
jgi:NADH:ubiquinone oxidoreductase subunit